MKYNFACFILSHGRANNVQTVGTLKRCGYTGDIYIIIDDEDDQAADYYKRYGEDRVIMFEKSKAMRHSDSMDNFKKHNIVLYARNQCHRIAKELGIDYFLELDDDYSSFDFRFPKDGKLKAKKCMTLDRLFDDMIDFLIQSDAMVVALSQGGDYMGGAEGRYYWKGLARKAMNSFFCRTDRPFKFLGSINEDTNMYITYGMQGEKVFSVTSAAIVQKETQQNAGGLTDIYLDVGTYVKSFYSVMCEPSCAVVAMMGVSHRRMHHKINWTYCTPMILSDKYRKTEAAR